MRAVQRIRLQRVPTPERQEHVALREEWAMRRKTWRLRGWRFVGAYRREASDSQQQQEKVPASHRSGLICHG